jgi:hypothetical protein
MHLSSIGHDEELFMQTLGPYLLGIAFWIFVACSSVTAIVAEYKKRRLMIELLRSTLDKGLPLDAAVVEKLMPPEARAAAINPHHLQLGGIITAAAGVGVMLLAYFLSRVVAVVLYPMMGAGAVVICVGLGLVVGARTLMTRAPDGLGPPMDA